MVACATAGTFHLETVISRCKLATVATGYSGTRRAKEEYERQYSAISGTDQLMRSGAVAHLGRAETALRNLMKMNGRFT